MRHAQIERLRALKKRISADWQSQDGPMDAGAVLADVGELVDILLMEREGMADGVVVPSKGRIVS